MKSGFYDVALEYALGISYAKITGDDKEIRTATVSDVYSRFTAPILFGFRVWVLGHRVWGLKFRARGLRVEVGNVGSNLILQCAASWFCHTCMPSPPDGRP